MTNLVRNWRWISILFSFCLGAPRTDCPGRPFAYNLGQTPSWPWLLWSPRSARFALFFVGALYALLVDSSPNLLWGPAMLVSLPLQRHCCIPFRKAAGRIILVRRMEVPQIRRKWWPFSKNRAFCLASRISFPPANAPIKTELNFWSHYLYVCGYEPANVNLYLSSPGD